MLFPSIFLITAILALSTRYSSSCSENEMEVECVNQCNTCQKRGQCDPPPTCEQGCDCKPGFYRDEHGDCVPQQQCEAKPDTPRCPKNAMFVRCCPNVIPSCENPTPEPDPEDECAPGCTCRPGFLKRGRNQCVPQEQCYQRKDTPGACREDEEYYECTPSCKNTCENINNPGVKCRCGPPGCFCREGLVKTADGKCVPPTHCPRSPTPNGQAPKCPKNAIFIKCGSPCPPTCDDLEPQPCEEKCITACYCKPGYLKRKDGVCVRPIDCQPRKKQERPEPKCPENAIFIECGSPCPPTCDNRIPEPCEENCTRACYCKPGFLLKSPEGKCVKPEHCKTSTIPATPQLKCNADEQFYECTPSCRNTCENFMNRAAKCYCGPPGCFCKEGLVKRADGKCVPPNQCQPPTQPACDPDEQFYKCTPSCKNTCRNFLNPGVRCRCGPPGCFCKEGLVKRSDGKCVPPSECPDRKPASCPENAEFSSCGPACRPTCRDPYPAPCATECVKGCFCKLGFVQDTDGRCVRLENCNTKCSLPGEEFQACGSPCPDTCENKGHPPASCPYHCNRGCFCKKGLYRNKSGDCVPLKDCDKGSHSTATPKPQKNLLPVTVPDDCHGCPNRTECETYCKTLGDFVGLCIGKGRLHCRCT